MTQDTDEVERSRPLDLAEVLRRYRIEVPIDEAVDREAWQDVAARDVIAEQ